MALLLSLEEGRKQVAEVGHLLRRGHGHVHLLGIGGIGMAGIAVHLAARGFRVSGCDAAPNRVSDALALRGIEVMAGHARSHLAPDVAWVVKSTAVPDDAPEAVLARQRGLPVFARGAVLPALLHGRVSVAVSGTHGKTTTAAMVAQILDAAGLRPGFCIGGELPSLGGCAAAGGGRYLAVEADESDGTVMLYEPDLAVITNIEFDHMEHFESEESLERCFGLFARNARQAVIYCADDPRATAVCARLTGSISYGFGHGAAFRGVDVRETPRSTGLEIVQSGRSLGRVEVPVPGRHNALNAVGAFAAAVTAGVDPGRAGAGLATFAPARRRFETFHEGEVTVISDYAHHPTEIRALVQTALPLKKGRVLAVFQPHRYTRTRALGADFPPAFEGLDEVVLVPVYEASERPLEGGTSQDLLRRFEAFGRVKTRYAESLEEAWDGLRLELRPGDLLLVVGAGDVEKIASWAKEFLETQETKR